MTEQLTQTLQNLHEQLQQVEDLDEKDREHLRAAVDEIQASLDQSDVSSSGLAIGFQETTKKLAEAHPQLARTAGQIADMLSQMGI